jgi:hypothetical protein
MVELFGARGNKNLLLAKDFLRLGSPVLLVPAQILAQKGGFAHLALGPAEAENCSAAIWRGSKITHPVKANPWRLVTALRYSELQGSQSITESKVASSRRPENAVWD